MYQTTRFNNISKAGNSYRVRVMKNNKKYSKCFTSCKQAILFRNEILNNA